MSSVIRACLEFLTGCSTVGVLHLSEGLSLCGGVGDNKAIPKTYAAAWYVRTDERLTLSHYSSPCRAPPLMYDLILMTLSLYKAVQYWRESPGSTGIDLVKVLIQDQAMYFVLYARKHSLHRSILTHGQLHSLIVNTSAQILSEVLQSSKLTGFLSVMGNPLMLCVLGSRLVVNMKEAGEKGENGENLGSSRSVGTVSDIHFS